MKNIRIENLKPRLRKQYLFIILKMLKLLIRFEKRKKINVKKVKVNNSKMS